MKHANEKNDATELVFLLDRSGSMAGLESDTVGGFNAMLARQREQEGECFVTTVLFDHESFVLHDRLPLAEVKPMTAADYTVRGCTALIDAMGDAIRHIADIHRYARPEDVPARTMFVVTTDGMENASRHFTADEVRRLVRRKKEEAGWEFLFIGANIDSVETAACIGIDADRAVNYRADRKGTKAVYGAVAETAVRFRASKAVSDDWCEEIRADYEGRGPQK